MRIAQSIVAIAFLWTLLLTTDALWGVAGFAFGWLVTAWVWLRWRYPALMSMGTEPPMAVSSVREARLAATQWRTGATWLAWWVAPQCVTPILLKAQGGVSGGRVGMSLAIATAPLTIGLAWLQARYPRYGVLVATGDRSALRGLAARATVQAGVVCTLGVIGAAAAVWLIGRFSPVVAARALTPKWILVLGFTNLAWLLVQSLSSYLRAWRQEPMTETAVIGALLVVAGTSLAAMMLPVEGVLVAYTLLIVGGVVPLSLVQFRRRHHVEPGADAGGKTAWSGRS